MVVPAFHGHAHNRACQLDHHVLMAAGFGLEDLETCERVFSSSNSVARTTRHATSFHRKQFIDMHFQQWDADKYENLGKSSLFHWACRHFLTFSNP
jgi:Kyakuja-Dileera-Zisupton transposase